MISLPAVPRPIERLEAERLVREQFRIIETGELGLAEANSTRRCSTAFLTSS